MRPRDSLLHWYNFDPGSPAAFLMDSSGSSTAVNLTTSSINSPVLGSFTDCQHKINSTERDGCAEVGGVGVPSGNTNGRHFILGPLDLGALGSADGFSICLWLRPLGNVVGRVTRIFSIGSGRSLGNLVLSSLSPDPSEGGTLLAEVYVNGVVALSLASDVVILINQWVHACLVNPTPIVWELYVNGTSYGRGVALAPFSSGPMRSNYLGRSGMDSLVVFRGFLDDVRIYGTALTSTEVLAIGGEHAILSLVHT